MVHTASDKPLFSDGVAPWFRKSLHAIVSMEELRFHDGRMRWEVSPLNKGIGQKLEHPHRTWTPKCRAWSTFSKPMDGYHVLALDRMPAPTVHTNSIPWQS